MRTTTYLNLLCCALLALSSCSTTNKVKSNENLIVGKWIVQSVNVDGESVPAALLGGTILFEFRHDGTASFTTPDGKTEKGRYTIKSGQIFDPDSPADEPVDIISLTRETLVLAMQEQGEQMEMTLTKSEPLVVR
ncbi:MAG: lipocalin family protein [Bacteroidota bacterium]